MPPFTLQLRTNITMRGRGLGEPGFRLRVPAGRKIWHGYMYIYIYVYIRPTYIHTSVYKYMHAYIHAYHIRAYVHPYTHTSIHAPVLATCNTLAACHHELLEPPTLKDHTGTIISIYRGTHLQATLSFSELCRLSLSSAASCQFALYL